MSKSHVLKRRLTAGTLSNFYATVFSHLDGELELADKMVKWSENTQAAVSFSE